MKAYKGAVLWGLSWIVAGYFGYGFISDAGFPPKNIYS